MIRIREPEPIGRDGRLRSRRRPAQEQRRGRDER
jgi:hypothetical protein